MKRPRPDLGCSAMENKYGHADIMRTLLCSNILKKWHHIRPRRNQGEKKWNLREVRVDIERAVIAIIELNNHSSVCLLKHVSLLFLYELMHLIL
jgi:hypothetical protein